MAFNFPDAPAEGAIFTDATSGAQYVYKSGVWMQSSAAQIKLGAPDENLIDNGNFQLNQNDPGNSLVSVVGYVCDRWTHSVAGMAGTMQRITGASASPSHWVMQLIPTLKASLAATDYHLMQQPFEGLRMKDLKYGTAQAKPVVLRFSAFANQAGTYGISWRNSSANRTFTKSFVLAANVWTDVEIVIPGCVDGTWVVDNTHWGSLFFATCCGTTYLTPEGVWTTGGPFLAPSNITNNSGGTLRITNVGLYADPLATGKAPPYAPRDFMTDLRTCQRYLQKSFALDQAVPSNGDNGAHGWASINAAAGRTTIPFLTEMRAIPTITFYSPLNGQAGTARGSDGSNYTITTMAGSAKNWQVQLSAASASWLWYTVHWYADARI